MNLMNRKLFKTRPARDKLNKMGGIMSSSQPLMQTVQKFAPGGAVSAPPYARVNPNTRTAPSQVRIPTRTPGPVDPNLAALQRANDPRSFSRFAANLANLPAAAYDTAVGLPAAALQNLSTMAQFSPVGRALGLSEPGEQRPDFVGSQVLQPEIRDLISENQPLSMEEVMAPGRVETMRGPTAEDVKESRQGTKEDAAVSDDLASEYLKDLGVSDSFRMPGVTPSPDKKKEAAAERLTDGAARDDFAAGPAAGDQALAEAKSGALGAEAQVKAVFNEGTEPEVEMTLEQLMSEFTEAAPERKGLDKNLAIAKIGFAMAAGQSPNAISNIATALSQGADMFIKDKKEKDAFDRQIKLSALQYGLTDIGKQRAEQRLIDREGRALKTYYNEKGESKTVTVDEIRKNGIPKGYGEPELIKAAIEREQAATKSIDELIEGGILPTKQGREESDNYKQSVGNIIGAETAIGLLENAYVDVVDGKVTGGTAAFKGLLEKGGNIFGIELGKEYKSIEQARDAFRFGLQKVIPVSVGATQSANSISDRDVDLLITAMFGPGAIEGGTFSLITQDADLMAERIGRAINEIRQGQRSELANLQSIESRLSGTYMPGSSRQTGVRSALTQVAPFQEMLQQAGFTSQGRPTTTSAGLTQVGVENGIPVWDFSK